MSFSHTLTFVRRYLSAPVVTGAIVPSSRHLAAVLTRPFAERTQPAHVLEVGAGTGAVTRAIAERFGPEDRLDICEVQPALADILERDVLGGGVLGGARRQGRVRLIRGAVEDISAPDTYDFTICGLPFTALRLSDVRRIMAAIERNLKPGGTFSYFEYVGLRRIACTFATGARRRRVREVSKHLSRLIERHEISQHTVWRNVPPAYGRHWSFDKSEERSEAVELA